VLDEHAVRPAVPGCLISRIDLRCPVAARSQPACTWSGPGQPGSK